MKKSTLAECRAAYDRFMWTLRDVTGGTHEETARRAPLAIPALQALADLVSELAEHPNAHVLKDPWLLSNIRITVPQRMEEFRRKWTPPPVRELRLNVVNWSQMFSLACKGAQKFGLFISFPAVQDTNGLEADEILMAAPYLETLKRNKVGDFVNIMLEGQAMFLFDSLEDAQKLFHLTVGDDGPTQANPYNGPCKVFAVTCDDKGNIRSENT